MARKKKKQAAPAAPVAPEKPLNLGYSGKIKLSIKAGKTTIATRNYTNHGTAELFRFLCLCLAGQYRAADTIRPTKIKLFYSSDTVDTQVVGTPASGYITNNTAARPLAGSADSYKVVFHFLVPRIYITGEQFNQIALYGTDNDLDNNFSALFNLTAKNEQAQVQWDTIKTSD